MKHICSRYKDWEIIGHGVEGKPEHRGHCTMKKKVQRPHFMGRVAKGVQTVAPLCIDVYMQVYLVVKLYNVEHCLPLLIEKVQ